jgi:hypothetical protein
VQVSDNEKLDTPKDKAPQRTTNRLKAIIFLNFQCISMAVGSAIFKALNREGVTPSEWMVWRNGCNFFIVLFFLVPKKINPVEAAKGYEKIIVGRVVTG